MTIASAISDRVGARLTQLWVKLGFASPTVLKPRAAWEGEGEGAARADAIRSEICANLDFS
jgi:hypothetical protein